MRNVFKLFLFVLFIATNSFAQEPDSDTMLQYSNDTLSASQFDMLDIETAIKQFELNHLNIEADERIRTILEIQKEESIQKGGFAGYRVQLYQGSKDEAYKIAANFMQRYPDNRVYIKFSTPDFRVRVGDFRTRSEAIRLKYQIEKNFPNPFIVEDIINFPDLVFSEENK